MADRAAGWPEGILERDIMKRKRSQDK